ncbi:S9 family peptidase [Colwellia psychrerythraea]|uniref:Protease II n=1 Tax=Colwellia psychrerythraea (strain 34H / ATCC BAA-681) TaxID=167879 RepID=Q47V81_COLP3|nr:oligopeptidase B [Colwellia psychrerythraea]AAZ27861.1 protease II [Colwellia psychrerythraea 34H]
MSQILSKTKLSLIVSSALLIAACSNQNNEATNAMNDITAPIAKKVPHKMVIHNHTRVDDYYWMRDDSRKNPEVLAHLAAENDYMKAQLQHTEAMQEKIFQEIKARIEKDDSSVPTKKGYFYYASQMQGENEYPIYVRSSDFSGSNLEVLLNVNELAKAHDYYQVSGLSASPDGKLLAYGEDTVSRRIYTVQFKDIAGKTLLDDRLEGTNGGIVWGNDNKTVYYIKKDPQTLLGYQVFRHTLGTPQATDEMVYEESNKAYYTGLSKSKDGSSVFIWHSSTEASGVSVIDADNAKAMPKKFIEREEGHEYSISKMNDWYYINTNWQATNFRLMKVNKKHLGDKTQWQDVIPANDAVKLEDYELFANHLVYQQRENGISRLTIQELSSGKKQQLSFNDTAYTLSLYGNNELKNNKLRLYYTSFTTPGTHYDVDLNTLDKTQLKQAKVLGDFDSNNYASERIFVKARDGKKVPVSLVYRKDKFKKDGTNPLYQYAYGSYGHTIDPSFSVSRLSLLDRGFVYAVAHIRGSEMLGRPWYEDGKKLTKMNTFTDFIDVTKDLTAQGYGDKENVFAVGGSAGGLLMGAVINMAPEQYKGIAAAVPFVDVVTTMLDESIPLTTNEFKEWGNPKEKTYYDYMLSYSPYDQVKAQDYPNILVTTGLHDSQVQYFEPMKWVAKLRDYKTDDNLLLFKTDMEAGHGGASGRFKRIHDTALQYSFFIDLLNKS